MNFLKWLAVAMFLVLSLTASASPYDSASTPEPVVADVAAQEQAAWEVACRWKRFDCSTIKPPVVVYKPLGAEYWGLYTWGAAEVLVDASIRGTNFGALTLIHEFVHYIQFAQGYHNRFSRESRGSCAREKEAFQAENEIAEAFQIVDPRIATWEEAHLAYGCQL